MMGLTRRSKGRRGGGWCNSLDCIICGEHNRRKLERRKDLERRIFNGWKWLKRFVGLDVEKRQ